MNVNGWHSEVRVAIPVTVLTPVCDLVLISLSSRMTRASYLSFMLLGNKAACILGGFVVTRLQFPAAGAHSIHRIVGYARERLGV